MKRISEPPRIAVLARPSTDWDAYVAASPRASVYHRCGWALLAQEVFDHEVAFFEARNSAGALAGVLAVVRQKNLLLGDFATSIPFFNYGGALGDSGEIALHLMQRAREWAESRGCSYLEFRDAEPRAGDWLVRTDKVSMLLELPASFEALSKQLGSKLRSQAKRADREEPTVRVGGAELARDFYDVFARNMRDLGTPVYPRRFFAAILGRFPAQCVLVVVACRGEPAAAGFLIVDKGRAEIPWAACREELKPLGFNMKLYWEVLAAVVARGCSVFDFGRSTLDAGTYRFKKQWGAVPTQLYWHRWERNPARDGAAQPKSEGRLMSYATAVWRKLPLSVANTLGPWVSPHLPW